MNKQGLLEWASKNLEGHRIHSTEILVELEKLGIEWKPEDQNIRLSGDGKTTLMRVLTFDNLKSQMINRGLGLLILDKSKPEDYVAYYSAKHRQLRVDADGELSKTAKAAYAVIGGDEFPVNWFGSTLVMDETLAYVDDLLLLRALHSLFGADSTTSGQMFGVGSAGRAMIAEMEKTLA
jgi:hypothetical protein